MDNAFESNPYQTPTTASTGHPPLPDRSYGGIRRLPYFGYSFLIQVIYYAVVFSAVALGEQAVTAMAIVSLIAFLSLVVAAFYLAAQRLINIGSNPWWCLGFLVPFLNIFVGVRCLVCPEGYADHKTIDTPAKVILGIAVAVILLAVFAVVASVVVA